MGSPRPNFFPTVGGSGLRRRRRPMGSRAGLISSPPCGEVACARRRPMGSPTSVYLLRMPEGEILGLLVATRDEPGILYRVSEAIFKHGANITYIAGGAHRESEAELQLEVTGAGDEASLIADLEGLEGIT